MSDDGKETASELAQLRAEVDQLKRDVAALQHEAGLLRAGHDGRKRRENVSKVWARTRKVIKDLPGPR